MGQERCVGNGMEKKGGTEGSGANGVPSAAN